MSALHGARTLVFDERFRFDTFVVGAGTHDALDAARVVAESPGARWNPLIVRGAAGAGKSHLLGAIASRARELRPTARVVALSAQEPFAAPNVRAGDLLLIDDVRAGVGPNVGAELRTLLDAALAAGAQVVLAEDGAAPTRDEATAWVSHSPRARLVRVGPPDAETRLAILRAAAATRGLALADDALAALGAEPVTSVRELLGRLSRAAAAPQASAAALGADTDFASFLDEVAREVAAHVEPWRLRIGEAAARWRAEGVEVEVLERALRLAAAPDVDALLSTFESAVVRLRRIEQDAVAHDPSLAGHAAFRDPARVSEAVTLVRRAAADAARAREAAQAAAVRQAAVAPAHVSVDLEGWVLEWPDVRDLLIEAWR